MVPSLRPAHPKTLQPRPTRHPAGFRILVPGYAQWSWAQKERAAVFFGTYAAAMAIGLFAWGSRAGGVMILYAVATHVASAADVIRQGAFPGFGRWVPTVSAACGLGLGLYAPVLTLASVVAWPDHREGVAHEGYLINRWAYRGAEPTTGDWVWFRRPGGGFGLGRLVAGPERSVEWTENVLRVEGQRHNWAPTPPDRMNLDLAMTVPADQFLIDPVVEMSGAHACAGLVLIPRDEIIGRAWAQAYPVWGRRLLF